MIRGLCACCVALLVGLGCAAECGAQIRDEQPQLILSVKITGQQYCSINPHLTSLQMELKLRYRNVGNQKLILYKGHDLFYQTKIRSVPGRSETRPYEITSLNSRYFDEEFEPLEQPSPSRVFAILPPGAAYERELKVNIGLVDADARRGKDAISEGEHELQLIISTWYKSRPLAQKLRQEWKGRGLLWFDPVVSTPIRFAAVKPRTEASCN
jgi:hypothetical protein